MQAMNTEPQNNKGRNPIFDLFPRYSYACPSGSIMDWGGSLFTQNIYQEINDSKMLRLRMEQILIDDLHGSSIFEWIDLLESVRDAKEQFVFIELGAGFGKWAIRAWSAARALGIDLDKILLVVFEADRVHNAWIKENFILNQIPSKNYIHFETAVSNFEGFSDFFIMRPDGVNHKIESATWYGQALVSDRNVWADAKTEKVPVSTLPKLLSKVPNLGIIDLIDMDIQGEEARIIEDSIFTLRDQVKKLHIGTHSTSIENEIYKILGRNGFECIRHYPTNSKTVTAYDEVEFVDGVMTWVNTQI